MKQTNPWTHSLTSLHSTQMGPRLNTQGIQMTALPPTNVALLSQTILIKPSQNTNLPHPNQKTLLPKHTVIGKKDCNLR